MTSLITMKRSSTARRKKILIVTGVLLLLLIWWRLWQGGVQLGPAHVSTSRISSNDNTVFSSGWDSTDDSRVATHTVWIISEGEGQLLDKIAGALKTRLLEDHSIREVHIGSMWPAERESMRVPDLTIRLRVVNLEAHDGLISRHLKATIHASLATGLAVGNGDVIQAGRSQVSGHIEGKLQHESDSIGDGIGSDRYHLTGDHIADTLAKSFRKQLDEWRGQYGELPDLPAAFYPPFRPAADVDFLKVLHARTVAAGDGLLSHNESFFTFEDARDTKVVLAELVEMLKASGWKGLAVSADYLHVQHDSRALHIFVQRESSLFTSGSAAAPVAAGKTAITYGVRYSDPMTDAECRGMWDELVRIGQWRIAAPTIQRGLTPDEYADYLKRLEAAGDKTSAEYYILADASEKQHDLARAKLWLIRAATIARYEQMGESPRLGKFRELAKTLGGQKLADDPLDEQTLRDMGLPELPAGSRLEKTLPVNQPFRAFVRDPNGHLHGVSATVTPGLKLRFLIIDATGGSYADTGEFQSGTSGWRAETGLNNLHARAERAGPDSFRISLHRGN